ncbi:helix-turn-helix domain-containing protein [Tenacibaculum sp.]|uniref:helix-turn-helix domain-containing protein n=1 Tax=Tenacibaculum sp. TaxID=1906242 RepID=UPI003AA858EC
MKLGWSQYEIGVKLHISQNAYYKLETGKTKLDLQRFIEITNLLEIKPEKLLQ